MLFVHLWFKAMPSFMAIFKSKIYNYNKWYWTTYQKRFTTYHNQLWEINIKFYMTEYEDVIPLCLFLQIINKLFYYIIIIIFFYSKFSLYLHYCSVVWGQ